MRLIARDRFAIRFLDLTSSFVIITYISTGRNGTVVAAVSPAPEAGLDAWLVDKVVYNYPHGVVHA
jgi:hypothetical protein